MVESSSASKVAVTLSIVVSIVSNVLSMTGIYGGTNATISRQYPTYLTPDGVTFSIWAVIYTLQLVMVCSQWQPSEATEALLQQRVLGLDVRHRITAVYVLNALWLPVFIGDYVAIAFVILAAYLATLFSIYTVLNTKVATSVGQWFSFVAPNMLHGGWVSAALCVNLFVVLAQRGFKDEFGIAGSLRASVPVAACLAGWACFYAAVQYEAAYSVAVGWALLGIYRMQNGSDPASFPAAATSQLLARVALACAVAVFAACGVGLFRVWALKSSRSYPYQLSAEGGAPLA